MAPRTNQRPVGSGLPAADLRSALRKAYQLMRAHHGHLHWWPGDDAFEICTGAILTQNTNWANVERAIANLKVAGLMDARKLLELPEMELARHIKPAGYYNVKARRLRAFLDVLVNQFAADLAKLFQGPPETVRRRLLAISGIGPETADSMLLYAGGHPSFVIDAYTKRIFSRHRWCQEHARYHEVQALCAGALSHKQGALLIDYWQDYHAQLVMVGKRFCRSSAPACDSCPLRSLLPSAALSS